MNTTAFPRGYLAGSVSVPNGLNLKIQSGLPEKPKWSFFQLVRYSLDGMISFSTAPLKLASFTGMFMCIISFLAIIFIIIRQLLFGGSAFGWPSMACIVIFIGGIQLLCIGILGSYLSRTYMEVKKRPIYIFQESNLSPDKAVKSE